MSNIPWIDSHCHWDFAAMQEQRKTVLSMMKRFEVACCIIPGTESHLQQTLIDLARRDNFPFAIGLHPYFARQHDSKAINQVMALLDQYADESDCVAIGECGLDRPQAEANLSDQEWDKFVAFDQSQHWQQQLTIFKHHIQWAKQFRLPLIVHARGTNDQCCAILRRQGFRYGGVVHAFSGSEQQARKWIELGFKLGVGGACSHDRAKKLRRVIQSLAADEWVLETDAPDMTPAFCQKGRNSPVMVPLTAALLAELRRTSISNIRTQAYHNTLAAFPKLARFFS